MPTAGSRSTRTEDKFLLIAASDAGYADASPDEFAKSGKLVLQPWGRSRARSGSADQPGANQEVMFQPRPVTARGTIRTALTTAIEP